MDILITLLAATKPSRDGRHFKRGLAALAVAVFSLVLAAPASANPISFYDDASDTANSTLRFTLGCGSASGDCSGKAEALFSTGPSSMWDSSLGDLFELSNSGIGTETSFVNGATGETFTTGTQDGSPNGAANYSFTTSAEYFLIKIGKPPNYALLHNLGGTLELFFKQTRGTGSGFSHFTEFGGVPDPRVGTAVPAPDVLALMALGILLLGVGLCFRKRG